MTEDAKPGFSLTADIGDEADLDIAIKDVFEDYGIDKLVSLDRDESVVEDFGFGSFERDSFDDGSAF